MAADEDELWRLRIATLNPLLRVSSHEEVERDRELCAAAIAYFERRQDWPALSMALDEYAGYVQRLGAYEDAREASKRRLGWPDLPVWARGDVQNMIGLTYFTQGEYATCIATVQDALAQVRPGDSLQPLSMGVGWAIFASYLSADAGPSWTGCSRRWSRCGTNSSSETGVWGAVLRTCIPIMTQPLSEPTRHTARTRRRDEAACRLGAGCIIHSSTCRHTSQLSREASTVAVVRLSQGTKPSGIPPGSRACPR
ncbi:MAG: hypothetical protein ACLQUY_02445 [Ktedonobacterales bacterium]